MLTVKRQTLLSVFAGDKYVGKLHEKDEGLFLSVAKDADGRDVAVPVTDETLKDIAHLQLLRAETAKLSAKVAATLGDVTPDQLAAAAKLVETYGIQFTSEVVESDSVLEDEADTPEDPAGATMIGSGELVHAAGADESTF